MKRKIIINGWISTDSIGELYVTKNKKSPTETGDEESLIEILKSNLGIMKRAKEEFTIDDDGCMLLDKIIINICKISIYESDNVLSPFSEKRLENLKQNLAIEILGIFDASIISTSYLNHTIVESHIENLSIGKVDLAGLLRTKENKYVCIVIEYDIDDLVVTRLP